MPRRRPMHRLDYLADALEAVHRVGADLDSIDLRQTSGELRVAIKAARGLTGDLQNRLKEAILSDVPRPVRVD